MKETLALNSLYSKKNGADMAQIDVIEKEIELSIQEYIVKLNEEQLGYTINQLVKWAKKKPKNEDADIPFNLHRQVVFNKVMIAIVGKLGEYAVPYIQNQFANLENVLKVLISEFAKMSPQKNSKKRTRLEKTH